MEPVEAARGSAGADRRRCETEGPQLLQPEDAMLAQAEIGEGLVEKRCLYLRFSTSLGHEVIVPKKT
ncbi:MAG: hypothetical protein ACLQA5_22860 [Solirubrobacteraceae bacterium]